MSKQNEEMTRPEKKSEAIEIRVPHETKQQFMDACKADERTASEVLRCAIDVYLDRGGFSRGRRHWLYGALFASCIAAVGATYVAISSLEQNDRLTASHSELLKANQAFSRMMAAGWEQENPLLHLYFDKSDTNGDERLTQDEFVKSIVSRGTVSDGLGTEGETVMMKVGVGVIIPTEDARALHREGLAQTCFQALGEIGDTQRAREFLELDTNADNQLTLTELGQSKRIPVLYEIQRDFMLKDADGDGLLTYDETKEDVSVWRGKNATLQNDTTNTVWGELPEACKNPNSTNPQGRLFIKAEKLKRFMIGEFPGGAIAPQPKHFDRLDLDGSGSLDFAEFVAWYNRGLGDFIGD
ncbi:EF-hand domain-containing protein [Kordiimonas lipolytica]|uniref:EF-hand domain-containing protein n=1 Tax=Kordiimonas lipolytica TaxID=1662421 RepID=A0ABV8UCP8_9PROT|nr:EF-hand domain-containing protein [Kordiimonas lipolytica]